MRKTRKQLVGKVEDAEREVRETELRALVRALRQQWRWQGRSVSPAQGVHFAVPA